MNSFSKKDFLNLIKQSVDNQTLIKLTFSKSTQKEDLKNVYVRLVNIKNAVKLSFTYRYMTRDEVKNYADTEGVDLIETLLGAVFLNAVLWTNEQEVTIQFDKNGENAKISFKNNTLKNTSAIGAHDHEKKRLISPNALYLNELGITTKDGMIKNDGQHKYRQINKYIEIIDNLLKEIPLSEKPVIADFGSGKGYLTFALYDHLVNNLKIDPSVYGFELRENLVDICNTIAQKAHFSNLKFIAQDINEFKNEPLDMLIALHACDIATDIAIAKGIQAGAKIIVVAPCCHKQIRKELKKSAQANEMSPILKNGIMEERQAELITDGIRALLMEANGYKTSVFEFISTEHTPKNVMIVGIKSKPKKEALSQVAAIKKHYGIGFHHLEKLL
jgi:protein-L-isoaspartate O-methyltransferase